MENVLAPLKNAWKIQDLRKKLFMMVLLLVLYRVGVYIPVPGLSGSQLAAMVSGQGSLLGFMDILAGGAFQNASIFAMSITPYINASIIMQLLTIAIPALERLSKEGEEGRKVIAQWIRYGTVILGFVEASAMYIGFRGAVTTPGVWSYLTITLSLTAGTAFIMWLGEQINQYGIGNGISMIIFVNIISRGPSGFRALVDIILNYNDEGRLLIGIAIVLAIVVVFTGVVAFVIWVTQAERRIPVQYAKRVVGRKMYGGQSTHIPMKVNVSGVIPDHLRHVHPGLPRHHHQPGGAAVDRYLVRPSKLQRRSALHDSSCGLCHGVYVLLYGAGVQPHRVGQQHPEERRVHSRYSPGQAYFGLHLQGPEPDHLVRRPVPRPHHHLPEHTAIGHESAGLVVRRYFAAHHGRRRARHHEAD